MADQNNKKGITYSVLKKPKKKKNLKNFGGNSCFTRRERRAEGDVAWGMTGRETWGGDV